MSHEIRSPLSVVCAGLEILKADLEALRVAGSILDLLSDINFANNNAIEILNDTLQYENIDSGIFKLELAVSPLQGLSVGRLEAYKYMAAKKDVTLVIKDLVNVLEYYNSLPDSETDGPFVPVTKMIASATTMVLYIDKFRVEQILRNLVSNAVKFTPNNGTITFCFSLVSISEIAAAAAVNRLQQEIVDQPILKLEDEAVDKQISSYLRIEIVDSGVGRQVCTISCLLLPLLLLLLTFTTTATNTFIIVRCRLVG